MSYTTLKIINRDGEVEDLLDLPKSHGVGPVIWGALLEKLGHPGHTWLMDPNVWDIYNQARRDGLLTEFEEAVYIWTCDKTWVARTNIPRLITHINAFHEVHVAPRNRVDTLLRVGEALHALYTSRKDFLGACMRTSSLNGDPWFLNFGTIQATTPEAAELLDEADMDAGRPYNFFTDGRAFDRHHLSDVYNTFFPGVRLEPVHVSHNALLMTWVNNPAIVGHIEGIRGEKTLEDEAVYLQSMIDSPADAVFSIFALTPTRPPLSWRSGYLGQIGLHEIDREAGTARMAVVIGDPEDHGMGWGTAAICTLIRDLRAGEGDLPELKTLTLKVREDNARARAIYERVGFTLDESADPETYGPNGEYTLLQMRYALQTPGAP